MDNSDVRISAVILAGGTGSRFWPASTPSRPKQLLPLATARPLLVDTWERALQLVPSDRLHVLTGESLRPSFAEVLTDAPASGFWIEPRARGTGPVLAWAAHRLVRSDPEAVMVSLHADHAIAPAEAMVSLLRRAARFAADEGLLVTVAIPPSRPETGYGWISPGEALADEPGFRAWRVGAFREKPDLDTARSYLTQGYLWNSGIFVWKARTFLDEVAANSDEIGPHLHHLDAGDPEAFFDAVDPVSVDEAVLERSRRVATVEATFAWDDVGSWDSLARSEAPDPSGNSARGAVVAVDSRQNLVWAEDGPVILWGVEDLVVVRAGGVTVVAPRDRAPRWKDLLGQLPPEVMDEADRHVGSRPPGPAADDPTRPEN